MVRSASDQSGLRRVPWPLWGAACLLSILLLPGRCERLASAAPTAPVLVLSVEFNGRHQERLTNQLTDFLGLTGSTVVDGKRLRGADRSCVEPECLRRLARQYQAALIVGASVELAGNADCNVSIWLFDARDGHDRTSEGSCQPTLVESRLKDLAGSLLAAYHLAAQAKASPQDFLARPLPNSEPVVSVVLPTPAVGFPRESSRQPATSRSGLRKGLAGAFGAMAIISLAGAIALHVVNGTARYHECIDGRFLNNNCRQDLTVPYATAYATAGTLALGMVLTLTLPGLR